MPDVSVNLNTMNTTEHLVEVYYRQLGCFTATDVKIEKGNNRQFDILAYNLSTRKYYHIEVSVAHGQHWQPDLSKLSDRINYKFFGTTRNNRPNNPKTDHAKGKSYLEPIKATYQKFGLDFDKIIRVWCTWAIPDDKNAIEQWKKKMATTHGLTPNNFEILNFRDTVMKALVGKVGTAYYDDELLRTMSLLKEFERQTQTDCR